MTTCLQDAAIAGADLERSCASGPSGCSRPAPGSGCVPELAREQAREVALVAETAGQGGVGQGPACGDSVMRTLQSQLQ